MAERPALLDRSLAINTYVMLRFRQNAAALADLLDLHLRWTIEQERVGTLMLSGPVTSASEDGLVGITVLRAGSEDEARQIADSDPFVEGGYVRYALLHWTIFEGSMPIFLRISQGAIELR